MSAWFVGIAITGGIALVLALFAKFCPKEKIAGFISPKMHSIGEKVSKYLIVRIGQGAANRVEQGIIVTVAHCLADGIQAFLDGLLEDNEGKK